MSNKRYFVLVENRTFDNIYLVGRNRKRVKDLDRGYINFKSACNSCDYLYRKKVMQGLDVVCNVVSLNV